MLIAIYLRREVGVDWQ